MVFGSLLRSKQVLVENMLWELVVSDRLPSKSAALLCADSVEDGIELLAHARGLGFSVAAFAPVDELEDRIESSNVAAVFLRACEATHERVAESFRVDQSRWHLGLHMIDPGEPAA